MKKTCIKCVVEKEETDFVFNHGKYQNVCSDCKKRADNLYRLTVLDKKREYGALYREKNREELNIKLKEAYLKRVGSLIDYSKDFIIKATKVWGGQFDYSKVVYKKSREKVEIICNVHKVSFWQSAHGHLHRYNGCPLCMEIFFEEEAVKILKTLNIEFTREESFCQEWCSFDFYLPIYNLVIEIDEDHHKSLEIQLKDIKKNKFLKDRNISIIRISVSHSNKEEGIEILNSILKQILER